MNGSVSTVQERSAAGTRNGRSACEIREMLRDLFVLSRCYARKRGGFSGWVDRLARAGGICGTGGIFSRSGRSRLFLRAREGGKMVLAVWDGGEEEAKARGYDEGTGQGGRATERRRGRHQTGRGLTISPTGSWRRHAPESAVAVFVSAAQRRRPSIHPHPLPRRICEGMIIVLPSPRPVIRRRSRLPLASRRPQEKPTVASFFHTTDVKLALPWRLSLVGTR